MTIMRRYMTAGGFTLLAKIVTVLSVFAEIYFLNALLGKDIYGDFVFALTMILTASMVLANPFRSYVLFRSRTSDPYALTRYVFLLSLVSGTVLSVAILVILYFGPDIGKPHMVIWAMVLVWIIPVEIARNVLSAFFQSKQNIRAMVFFNSVAPHLCRMAGLAVIWFLNLDNMIFVMAVYWMAASMPLIVMMARHKLYPAFSSLLCIKKDAVYIAHMICTQIVQQASRIIDLFLVGILLTSAVTAEYAVAAKFAAVLFIGKQMTEHLLTPRLHGDNVASLRREYDMTRDFGVLITLTGIVGFACLGRYILPVFGNYGQNTSQIFFLLSAAALCRTATGCSGEYLAMKGHSAWVLGTNFAAMVAAGLTAFIAMPVWGAHGAATAAVIGAATGNIGAVYACYKTEKFICIPLAQSVLVAIMFIICMMYGFGIVSDMIITMTSVIVLVAFALSRRHYLYMVLQQRSQS